MNGFASKTEVAPEKTRAEIERTLQRYKATGFASGWSGGRAYIMFQAAGRLVRFTVALPERFDFARDGRGWLREPKKIDAEHEQAIRSTWRRLLLCIKAKLESVESKIETFEEAFESHIVLPNGQTVGEWLHPQIAEAYRSNGMPPMLALPAARDENDVADESLKKCDRCGRNEPADEVVPVHPAASFSEIKAGKFFGTAKTSQWLKKTANWCLRCRRVCRHQYKRADL